MACRPSPTGRVLGGNRSIPGGAEDVQVEPGIKEETTMTKKRTWIGSALAAVALLAALVGGGGTQAAYGQSSDHAWGYCTLKGQNGVTYLSGLYPFPNGEAEAQFSAYVSRRFGATGFGSCSRAGTGYIGGTMVAGQIVAAMGGRKGSGSLVDANAELKQDFHNLITGPGRSSRDAVLTGWVPSMEEKE